MSQTCRCEIFRPTPQQRVADAATDEIGNVVALPQPGEHLSASGSTSDRERVLSSGHHRGSIIAAHCTKPIGLRQ